MNYLILALSLFFSSPALSGQDSQIKTAIIETRIYCDHCYQCESCDQNIYSTIKRNTKGVRKIKVDGEDSTIEVTYNSNKTSIDKIEKAISLAGFKANELEADPESYAKLDQCCKKK